MWCPFCGSGWGGGAGAGFGWIGGLLMMGFGLLVVVGLVALIVWAVRSASGHPASSGPMGHMPGPGTGEDEALAIARRRLAAGEITAEQYDEIVRTLRG